uniref:Uncharacterized protein n=1 Tax=viral metagenome TaxID=1070528 RepID=A0A6C0B3K2_9ZZZZ
MANIDLSLSVICSQRKKRTELSAALAVNLPPRYTPTNPYVLYPQYRQFDFDMRRKAEILRYDKNSTQSNSKLTKSQQYSKLVNAAGSSNGKFNDTILYQDDGSGNFITIVVKYPDTYSTSKVIVGFDPFENPKYIDVYNIIPGQRLRPCPDNFPIPTSSSDVPGPIINLYNDTNVPLIYYNKNVQAYGITNPNNTNPWTTATSNNIFFSDTISKLFMNLIINNAIDNYSYTFAFQIPISIYFTATVRDDVPDGLIYLPNNTINIDTINVFTYYNGQQITYQKQPIITLDNDETLSFDISLNKRFVSQTSYDEKGLLINTSYYNNTITGQYYLGMLNITNLYLLTSPSYIYDINLNFFMSTNMNALFTSYFDIITVGVYCNVDSSYYPNIAKNIILRNNSTYQLGAFGLSGI